MNTRDRAEYFRKRREKLQQFVAMVDKDKFHKLMEILQNRGTNKTRWLNEKIDEEIKGS